MLNSKFISLNRVVERVHKSGLNNQSIDFYDIIEYVGEAIRLIGVSYALEKKVTNGTQGMPEKITIANFRGTLPTDIVHIDSAREQESKYPMVYTTSSFPQTYGANNLPSGAEPVMLSYYVQGAYIITNFEEGYVEISYTAFKTDDDGYPMIPDEERYIRAIVAYCEYMIGKRLWMKDKLSERKFQYLEQEWLFYVNSAATKAHIGNLDRSESFKNQLQRMFRTAHSHSSQFNYLNKPEIPNY